MQGPAEEGSAKADVARCSKSEVSPPAILLHPPPTDQQQPGTMLVENFRVNSPNVVYSEDAVESRYVYQHTEVEQKDGQWTITPKESEFHFKTDTRVPKLGCARGGARALLGQPAAAWGPAAAFETCRRRASSRRCCCNGAAGGCRRGDVSVQRAPPRPCPCSVMLVGWGGNNGTTVTGGILANKQ